MSVESSQNAGEIGNALVGDAKQALRKPWSTPIVIAAPAGAARANVTFGTDGTDTQDGYQYGS